MGHARRMPGLRPAGRARRGRGPALLRESPCPARVGQEFGHFVGGMDIDGLGWAVLSQLLERGLVKRRGDFFRLSVEDLESLDRFARKSAENLHAAIQKARRRPLERVIAALGIPQVGWTTAIELATGSPPRCRAGDGLAGARRRAPRGRPPPRIRSGSRSSRASARRVSAALATLFGPAARRGRARGPRRRRASRSSCRRRAPRRREGRSPARRSS